MPYTLKAAESAVTGAGLYKNAKGNTECVTFVQQAAGAPSTSMWAKGTKVADAAAGAIPRGTAIATFDDAGTYPTDLLGRHAAIYLSHDAVGINVLDQWNKQGRVRQRKIKFAKPSPYKRSNDGKTFYVID